MESIALDACLWCLEGQLPHQDWHPTRADLLSIGDEMSRRAKSHETWEIKAMPDDRLIGFGLRLRRLLTMAETDGLPDFLADLARESLGVAMKEWRWRRQAARMGADPIVGDGRSWVDRVERVKALADLSYLIVMENDKGKRINARTWACCCPFHADREPSLDIDMVKNVWICRACNVGGDAFTYVELRYGLSFVEALHHLEQRCGIEPPAAPRRRGAPLGGVPIVT